jgi:glycine/D-amino acid oxidase-like deaminating enzyme
MRVVICGGGVIGACTAYFLSRRGIEVTVVERTEVADAASGKAGGFLALDWCTGSPLDALARRSLAARRLQVRNGFNSYFPPSIRVRTLPYLASLTVVLA